MSQKKKDWDKIAEIFVVVMLGITALLTAWASWIGSLHGGNQESNYTESNNLASEGNSMYVEAFQTYSRDVMVWNDIYDMLQEVSWAQEHGDEKALDLVCRQLLYKLYNNLTPETAEMLGWNYDLSDEEFADATGTILKWLSDERSMNMPLADADYVDGYFREAQQLLEQSREALMQGEKDSSNSDSYGFVTLIYSVVLFLLGIAGNFRHTKSKFAVIIIATAVFLAATVYMAMLPMPTGFRIANYLID